jgi:RHS repeat-associated protein
MDMPGRSVTPSDAYKYGFNGKINEKELSDGAQDLGERIYDNRLGRFFSTDPEQRSYPMWSPYNYANNSPVAFTDNEGLNPRLTITIKTDGSVHVKIENAIMVYGKQGNLEAAKSYLSNYQNFFNKGANVNVAWGSGITNVTFEVATTLQTFASEQDAIAAHQKQGFGLLTKYSSDITKNSFWKDNRLNLNSCQKLQFKKDTEHEIGHDWGMADMYVGLVDENQPEPSHGYKLQTNKDNSITVILDLMNDAFSPISNDTWKKIGMQIIQDYGCMGPGTYVINAGPMHLDLENGKAANAGGDFSAGVKVDTRLGAQNLTLQLKKDAIIFKGNIIKNPGGSNTLNKNDKGTKSKTQVTSYQNARFLD